MPLAAEDIIRQLQQKVQTAEQKLQFAELKIQVLEERLRLRRIEKYGPSSEKLSHSQLELLEWEPGVSQAEVQAESKRSPLELESIEPQAFVSRSSQPRKHPGRQSLPPELPRVEVVIPCTSEQCVCGRCGGSTRVIGYEVSEQLDVEPAKYVVRVTKREKRACESGCEEGGVVSAPVPVRIIEKGLVSDQVVIDTVVRKYGDHLPLYRQSAILERETGLEISRATLNGWVMSVGEMLRPIVAGMSRELVEGSYLQADETTVAVQMHDGRGSNHEAYLWQYGRPGGATVFDFRMGRGREGPQRFLENFCGILQTDGYQAYDKIGGPGMVHAACWTQARRGFVDVAKLTPGDPVATPIVARINELFAIDAGAREQELSIEARHQLRQDKAPTLLNQIKAAIETAQTRALPSSALGKACKYTLGLWPRLICFLEHPELELSNNLAENSIRPIALGRKNWIHVGAEQAGPRVAAILSVVETCRRLKIRVREYLAAVLPGLANRPIRQLAELTPSAWAARHQ